MISVSWTPNSDGGSPITGYVVTATGPDGIWTCAPASVADTSCMLSGLPGGQSYFVYVQATNAAGTSSASIGQFVTTADAPPSAPTDVSGDPGDGQVTVTWAASTSTGGSPITGYTVTSFPDGETCRDDRRVDLHGARSHQRQGLHVHRDGHQRHRYEP